MVDFDVQIEELECEKKEKDLPPVPGLAIERIIKEMSKQETTTSWELEVYSNELALSLREYE